MEHEQKLQQQNERKKRIGTTDFGIVDELDIIHSSTTTTTTTTTATIIVDLYTVHFNTEGKSEKEKLKLKE